MNTYQKVGTFLVRVVGGALLFVASAGPFGVLAAGISGTATPSYPSERWLGSFVWAVAGAALILASKPLGRLAGRGLD